MSALPQDDHFIRIYKTQAAAYHELIAAEDVDGNLLPALEAITPLAGKRILDLGSGSGRIPLLFKDIECEMVACELQHAMLLEQAAQANKLGCRWPLVQADGRQLPLAGGWADVSMAGWAYGHFTGWVEDWQAEAARALAEMQRATKPGGVMIVLETLGTGVQKPGPPNAALADYYAWIENELGFERREVATDYDFGSVERAAEVCAFFFGAEMAAKVRAEGWSRVPEWTGVWSKTKG